MTCLLLPTLTVFPCQQFHPPFLTTLATPFPRCGAPKPGVPAIQNFGRAVSGGGDSLDNMLQSAPVPDDAGASWLEASDRAEKGPGENTPLPPPRAQIRTRGERLTKLVSFRLLLPPVVDCTPPPPPRGRVASLTPTSFEPRVRGCVSLRPFIPRLFFFPRPLPCHIFCPGRNRRGLGGVLRRGGRSEVLLQREDGGGELGQPEQHVGIPPHPHPPHAPVRGDRVVIPPAGVMLNLLLMLKN